MYSLCVGFIKFLHIIKLTVVSKYAYILKNPQYLKNRTTWTDLAEHLGMDLQTNYFGHTIYIPQCKKHKSYVAALSKAI